MNIQSLERDPQAATRAPQTRRELATAERIYLQRLYTKLAAGYFARKAEKQQEGSK